MLFSNSLLLLPIAGKPPDTGGSQQAVSTNAQSSSGAVTQPSFYYHGAWIPLILNIAAPPGSHRAL
jgi:cell wall assembly regulator SMI1